MVYDTHAGWAANRRCQMEPLEPRQMLTATVPPAPLLNLLTDGTSFTGTVANFSTLTVGEIPNLTAVIRWGDGQKSNGTIQAATTGTGLDVIGTHTYETGGSTIPVRATIFSTAANWVPPIVFSVAQIAGPTFTTHLIDDTNATFSGTLGRVSGMPLGPFAGSAIITWGDGTVGAGQVILNSNGNYHVSATHDYSNPGLYAVGVTVELSAAQGEGVSIVGPKFITTIYETAAGSSTSSGGTYHHVFGVALAGAINLLGNEQSLGGSVNSTNVVLD